MRFRGLDLNLIHVLGVLREERSVSAAGRRLHLSQPATSAALARLREYFGDELLASLGKSMYLTPFAEGLRAQVSEFLRVAEDLVAVSTPFYPATSHRTFRIVVSDSVISSVLIPLVARVSKYAQNLLFDFILPDPASQAQFHRGEVDLLICPEGYVTGDYPTELFYEEQHVVAGWSESPFFLKEITEESIFERGHVSVAIGAGRTLSFGDRQIELLGRVRKIEVTVAGFAMAPLFLVGTQRLTLMHGRLAEAMARQLPINFAPLPFPFPTLRQVIHHHHSRRNDPGVRWLLGELKIQAGLNA